MGITPVGSPMTYAEAEWWSCRNMKKPFIADQLNILITRSMNVHLKKGMKPIEFYRKNNLEDKDFVNSALELIKETRAK